MSRALHLRHRELRKFTVVGVCEIDGSPFIDWLEAESAFAAEALAHLEHDDLEVAATFLGHLCEDLSGKE